MLKSEAQQAFTQNLQQLIALFPTGFFLLNDDTGELYAASQKAMSWLKLENLPTAWANWPVSLHEFQLALEGPDVRRAEVTIPWPENPLTFGFNLSTVKLDELGQVRVCLFTDITQVIQERLALEQFQLAFVETGSAESQLDQLKLALPSVMTTLSALAIEVEQCHALAQTLNQPQDAPQQMGLLTGRLMQRTRQLADQFMAMQGEPLPQNIRQIELAEVVQSAWQLATQAPVPEGLTLPTGEWPVLADSIRLEQALALLLKGFAIQQPNNPDQWVPVVQVQPNQVVLQWGFTLNPSGVHAVLAHQLVQTMGGQVQHNPNGVSVHLGRWWQ
jgi:hypothetical protein